MRKQKGFAELLSLLLAASIMLVIAAVFIASLTVQRRGQNENAAAMQLAQISAAEFSMMQLYGIAVPPAQLTGTLANPINCANPMLASGAQIQPPAGYAITFTPGATVTSTVASCSPVTSGVSAYKINLDPTNSLQAQRHFYTDQSQVLRFATGRQATNADPVYPVAIPTQGTVSTILSVGTGTTTPTPIPPVVPNPPQSGPGTYTVTATSNATPCGSNTMSGTITVDGSGNLSGSLACGGGSCSVNGVITASGANSNINFAPGGGCSWGGTNFVGGGSIVAGLSFNGSNNGNTMNIVGA